MHIKSYNGFSLIELLFTLIIAAILLAVGAPSFSNVIKDNRLTSQINSLVSALGMARSEALKRSQPVSVCKSSNGTTCNANWTASNQGWAVFVDADQSGSINAGEEILRVNGTLESGTTLRFSNNFLTFDSQGSSPGLSGTFVLCDDRGASSAKAIIVLASGLVRLAIDTNGDDTVEDLNGNNITCP